MAHMAVVRIALVVLGLVVAASTAGAQPYESIGVRAQGMAGAFVAVADDATATWWNPAGQAGGDYFSVVLEGSRAQEPSVEPAGGPAWKTATAGFAAAYPALGLSYYRLRLSDMRPIPATADVVSNRQDEGSAGVSLRALALQQFGATVAQSIGGHLVVATTLKLWRGAVGAAVASSSSASLARAGDLEGSASSSGDLDVGAMVTKGGMKLGLAVRNLREPTFGDGDVQVMVPRQIRAGTSFRTGRRGIVDVLTVAFDADLTTTVMATGEARHIAAGIEAWLASRRIGLRGGVSANSVGTLRPSAAGGASVAVRSGLYVEGALMAGLEESKVTWTIGSRLTF